MSAAAKGARGALLLAALAALPALVSWLKLRDDSEFLLAVTPVARVRAGDLIAAGPGGALWLDTREAGQFAAGHLPGAINVGGMGADDASAAIAAAWRPGLRPVAYGDPRDLVRPRRAAARLTRDMGIGPVAVLAGDWRRVGMASPQGARP